MRTLVVMIALIVGCGPAQLISNNNEDPEATCAQAGGHECTSVADCPEVLPGSFGFAICCEVPCQSNPSTCLAQGGYRCGNTETCAGGWLEASDTTRCCDVACQTTTAQSRTTLAPPSGGMYLGVAEPAQGQVREVEQYLGQKTAIFWPYEDINEGPVERAPDQTTGFNATKAEQAWHAGYLIKTGFEPHPENGFLVDDVLRGQYDAHFSRHAAGLRAFGKPGVLFEVAREPNLVLGQWLGGYGPAGDQSRAWAVEHGRTNGDFDPSSFPHADLYAGLGDPSIDDGVERLVAMQRYLFDFYVNREKIDFLTFGTMGWGIMGVDVPAEGYTPLSDYIQLVRLLGNTVDWLTLNFYSYTYCSARNLSVIDAWIQRLRQEKIDKPILFTELGFCSPNRANNVTAIFDAFVRDYPEVAGFSLWMVRGCRLDASVGFPELKAVIDAHPDYFHSCPAFSDGTGSPSCSSAPYSGVPQSYPCADQCADEGGTPQECARVCQDPILAPAQCEANCLGDGDPEECANYCGTASCP